MFVDLVKFLIIHASIYTRGENLGMGMQTLMAALYPDSATDSGAGPRTAISSYESPGHTTATAPKRYSTRLRHTTTTTNDRYTRCVKC